MISIPTTAPITVPCPPDSGVPPMITAATTTSTKSEPSLGSMAPRKPTYITPDSPQIAPISISVCNRTQAVGMPDRRAASGLLPTACTR